MEALKKRHTATLARLWSIDRLLFTRLQSLESQNQQLRNSLDELAGEVRKEKYGRRREIGLRIRMAGREQRIAEGLRRWVRQSEEVVRRLDYQGHAHEVEHQPSDALLELSQDARILLDFLEQGGVDEETAVSLSGSRARELIVHGGVDELLEELRIETDRRVKQQTAVDEKLESKSNDFSGSRPLLDRQIQGGVDEDSAMVVVTTPSPEEEDGHIKLGTFRVEEINPNILPQHAAEDTANISESISRDDAQDVAASSHFSQSAESTSVDQPSDSSNGPLATQPIVNSSSDNPLSTPAMAQESDACTDPLEQPSEQQHASHSAPPNTTSVCHEEILPVAQQMLHTDVTSLSPCPNGSQPCVQQQFEGPLHPLLAELKGVNKRYDFFQHEFRECHSTLEGLKATLVSGPQSSTEVHSLPAEFLLPAVARLDDFTEDVRVELEIRVGDEELLVKGYEALLRVPGALSSSSGIAGANGSGGGDGTDVPLSTDIEREIKGFVDGTDPTVKRTKEMFMGKLEDVQHDIAILKRAIHDLWPIESEQSSASTSSPMGATSVQKAALGFDPTSRLLGGSWSTWIRGPPTPTSSIKPSSGFGSIVTSPKLPQTSSQTARVSTDEGSGRLGVLGSFVGLGGKEALPRNPLSALGLRVALPSFHVDGHGISPMSASFGNVVSPSYSSSLGIGPAPIPKSRSSSMYMLGLGGSGMISRTPSNGSCVSSMKAVNGGKVEEDTEPERAKLKDNEIE